MEYTARQIAEIVDGRIEGDASAKITGFSRIENGKKGTICFFANPKYEKYVYTTDCTLLIVNDDFVPKTAVKPSLVRVKDSYAAVATLLEYESSRKNSVYRYRGFACRVRCGASLGKRVYVGDFAYIGKKAKVGDECRIGEHVYIGDGVQIGDRCTIYPGVKIYPGMVIGSNVILHAGVVIGSDGFGFAPLEDGTYRKIMHSGNVIIEDDVEIGANTTVDKSQIGSTIIHKGVKIDNLCQIAHNVEIGENTVIAAQSGIAGSAKIGRHCIIAGQVGISGHLTIADNTTLGPQCGVISSIKESDGKYFGTPSMPYGKFMRSYVLFKNAPDKKD